MKKTYLLIWLGILAVTSCTSAPISTPIVANEPTLKATLKPTKTALPIPSTITPTLESIHGGWNTLHNPNFMFSFQYPAVYNKGFQSFESTCNLEVQESDNNLHILIGEVQIFGKKTNKNLTEYVNYYIDNNRQGWQVKQNEIEIDGVVARRLGYHQERPPRGGDVTIVVNKDKAIVVQYFDANFINCGLKEDGYSSYWVYEQIVASLMFQE